jgi:hypothetical protein
MEKDERDIYINIMKGMADVIGKLVFVTTELKKRSDASTVLVVTQILKDDLDTAIRTKISPLTRKDIHRIIGRSAPHNNINTLIEVAHALGILDDATYGIAVKIKDIRNIIGHNKKVINLNVEPALSTFMALHTNPAFTGTYIEVFLQYATVVDQYIHAYLSAHGITVGTSPTVS